MHWTLSFSVYLRRFPFSSFGTVAFCVGCGVVCTHVLPSQQSGSFMLVYSGGKMDGVQGGHEECVRSDLIFLWQSG